MTLTLGESPGAFLAVTGALTTGFFKVEVLGLEGFLTAVIGLLAPTILFLGVDKLETLPALDRPPLFAVAGLPEAV
jgi:hypothetical protein